MVVPGFLLPSQLTISHACLMLWKTLFLVPVFRNKQYTTNSVTVAVEHNAFQYFISLLELKMNA